MASQSEREVREHRRSAIRPAFGRSTLDIECPFCSTVTTAYLWSLAGGGKKCGCGALHTSRGVTLAPQGRWARLGS
jgi:hypothetical protein